MGFQKYQVLSDTLLEWSVVYWAITLTKKNAAFFVPFPCHFVQLRAKCWALRAKGRASQGTN